MHDGPHRDALRAVFESLEVMDADDRAAEAVLCAAKLLEVASYALAKTSASHSVTHLFLLASELERKADTIRETRSDPV